MARLSNALPPQKTPQEHAKVSKPIQPPPPTVIREVSDEGKRAITLNVPQGIGDIFWCYQKIAPYFDLIHFNIMVTCEDKVQIRASTWLELLPKTGSVKLVNVLYFRYASVIAKTYPVVDVLAAYEKGQREFDYACNYPLEQGIKIRDIDPELVVDTDVQIEMKEAPLKFQDYIAVYVSGGTKDLGAIKEGCWNIPRWTEFLGRFDKAFNNNKLPITFIGANYDKEVISLIAAAAKRNHKIESVTYIDSYPANVCYILKKAKFLIAYQSGLNILADNLGTPQFMMYLPKLKPMMYTWCKPEHVQTKFRADLFSATPYLSLIHI